MIGTVYPYLILAGLTIGAVLLYLTHHARAMGRTSLELIRLNEETGFDTLNFLGVAWPLLERAGLRGMAWKADWFGVRAAGAQGVLDGRLVEHELVVDDMRLQVQLSHSESLHERRYFEQSVVETFLLLLRTDMWIKAGAINGSIAQLSRLNLFLQHDIKNIAQFIQLTADQLATLPPGKEAVLIDHLRHATPLIRHRADQIVRRLTMGQANLEKPQPVGLRQLAERLCQLHQLEVQVEGELWLDAPAGVLDAALDNILKNYADLRHGTPPRHAKLRILISATRDGGVMDIAAPDLPLPANLERLFEPFWSSHGSGLGIGLYQARSMLMEQGGNLEVEVRDGVLHFLLNVPRQAAAGHE